MANHPLYGAVGCLLLGIVGLYAWEQSEYNTDPGPINKRVWYGYNRTSIVGLMSAVTFLSAGVALLYGAASQHLHLSLANLARRDKSGDRQPPTGESSYSEAVSAVYRAVGLYVLLATTLVVVGVVAVATWGRSMMACGVIFCVGNQTTDTSKASYKGDPINAGIAFMVGLSLCPMGVVMWWRGAKTWRMQRAHDADDASSATTREAEVHIPRAHGMHRFVPPSRRRELLWMSGYVVLLLFFAIVSFYMPGDTRDFKPTGVASYAGLVTAPYANPHNSTHTAPELPRAFMRTRSLRLNNSVVLKLYPGNVLFFAYIILLILTVWGVRQSVTSRYWMSRRFSFYPSLSFGEGILALSLVIMVLLFFVYWTHDHNYKGMWTLGKAEQGYMYTSELFARGFGMLATLLLSFLMFPISRHSFLHRLLGSSYETVLWTHRILGYGMLIATALHVLLFFWAYYDSGQLKNNLNYIPTLCCSHLVRNDFVVPVVTWTTYVMFITMGIFALNRFRRRFYELFYYSHLLSTYSMIPVLLWHVASGWQYLVPGVTLWFIDCLVRLFQRSALVDVQGARVVSDDVVVIGFAVDSKHESQVLQRAYPGQYVFLSVAELSSLQWHPFTLSSVAGGGGAGSVSAPYTVHIKSMGPGTWTQRLYDRVARGEPLTLAVEGPCGSPLDVAHYDELFLVCGGIGVTPCASIFGSVLRWARAQACAGGSSDSDAGGVLPPATLPRRVKLIWACRSAQLVQAMAPSLGVPPSLHTALMTALAGSSTPLVSEHSSTLAKPEAPREGVPEGQVEAGGSGDDAAHSPKGSSSQRVVDAVGGTAREPAHPASASDGAGPSPEHQSRICADEVAAPSPAVNLPSPEAAVTGVRVGDTWFEVVVYMTREDEFTRLRAVVDDVKRNDRDATGMATVPLKTVRGRPDLEQEVVEAHKRGIDGTVAADARALIFACGPEQLTTDATAIGAKSGIPVHQEESYF